MTTKTKIVISARYGGFGLSPAAAQALVERGVLPRIGIDFDTLRANYVIKRTVAGYQVVHWESIENEQDDQEWEYLPAYETTEEAFAALNKTVLGDAKYHITELLARHDPDLVAVVEELGDAANGNYADLRIVEIEGTRYRVCEYDGFESVETPESIEWTDAI